MSAVSQRLPVPGDAPVGVIDIDLALPGEFSLPGGRKRTRPQGRVMALVRLRGRPLGMVYGDSAHTADLWQTLALAAQRDLGAPPVRSVSRTRLAEVPPVRARHAKAPFISVIVPTHNRCDLLRRCLDSVLGVEYPGALFEIIVVDNAPADDATERLVRETYGNRVRYVREPVAGGGRARSRGLASARGSIAAFTDDDTQVDPRWLSAIAETFCRAPETDCVTGLIAPAELQTVAQTTLERHNEVNKDYSPRTWSLRDPPEDPLFPFTAGQFGGGANMAFRTELLRDLGGFDPATGPGTPAHGGEDLLAFFQVLARGGTLVHQPDAIVWHSQRRSWQALRAQMFAYGAGFGAFLTAAVIHEPHMLPALLRRLPGGIRYTAAKAHRLNGDEDAGWSRTLTLVELQGLLYGPLGYLRGRWFRSKV
ncbi:glycosyltransferase [Streptomyces tuirus]|uniref:Glycosyltransferase 2-like domain-containing protein n=1 Tax=Streptomyces tuirus TaxID=68278 RepID=A0A7G1NS08_9ACTN|nr:glycosyltransferase family 2 protein [Streptomyces tuirus]BCL24336.1 hypothetical protein GCM10017668_61790 [Streptomyces tuirus]